jgi:glycosyltransferase involved in cell wall biosynthesis
VNLIGHAFEVFGIGEDVRMAALALSSADVPFCVVNVHANNGASRSDRSLDPQTLPPGKLGPYRFNLVCLAAPSHGAWIAREGMAQQRGRTTIVAWPWETQSWPRAWECLIPLADVLWPSSTFTAQALKPFSDPCRRPMRVMPMAVHIDNPEQYRQTERRLATRERWGLDPDAQLVLLVFDVKSSLARKNPWGAIEAFQRAFTERESNQVQLVIKALRPIGPNIEWEKLQRQAQEDPRLRLIDQSLERQKLLELMGCCDVFLSMHRSEGFGRGIAEAGILGLEVVTSSFGGNADFCLGSSFYLVSCKPSVISANAYPQAEGHIWGEPNREEAIQHLRRATRNHPPLPAAQSSRAINPVLDQLTREACGQRYFEELNQLQNILASPGQPIICNGRPGEPRARTGDKG